MARDCLVLFQAPAKYKTKEAVGAWAKAMELGPNDPIRNGVREIKDP